MRFLLIILFLFFALSAQAQYIDTKILTANEGLISNDVKTMMIDAEGRLWVGARAGLSMKKGTKFVPSEKAGKYKFNNIYDLTEDSNHNKWIAGYGQGVLFFSKDSVRLIDESVGLANDIVRSVFYHDNSIYAGTLNGISIISAEDYSVVNPDFTQHPDYFFTVTDFFTINQKIYATTLNDGIYEVTPQKVLQVNDIKKAFSSIVWKGKLYIGTDRQILQLNPNTFEIIKTFDVGNVWKFLPIGEELLVVSSGIYDARGGVYRLQNEQFVDISDLLKIPFFDLNDLAFDVHNQLLYIGTQNNGLIQVNLNAPVFHQDQLHETFTMNVHGNQQFVFHDQGFTIFSDNQPIKELSVYDFKNFQLNHPSNYRNHAVIQNNFYPMDDQTPADKIIFYNSRIHQNHLWVSTNIGLFELDLSGKILSYHPIHIYYFTFFQNDLVAAVPYAGIRIFHDIHKMDYSYFHDWGNPDIPTEVVSIAQTDEAVYFASALTGLFEYKNNRFRSLFKDQTFTEPKIKRICLTKEQHLAVVTDFNEVYILDISQPETTVIRHIPHEKVKGSSTGFVQEIDGVLYVGTNLGINVFTKDRYFFIDKAQGFTDYGNKTATTAGNLLYVGSKNGYFIVNNDYFRQPRHVKHRAIISDIWVNNEPIVVSDNIINNEWKLKYNQNNIRLFFSVPDAKYPDKLTFKYRLKETEPWQELTDKDRLTLNYLNDGNYEVQLQITDEDTGSISVQRLLLLTIQPPFYYSTVFIVSCILVLMAGSWLIYKRRIRNLKKNQERELAWSALQNEQEKKELLFEKKLADVRLQALKSQMNSHFLFNVLGSVQYHMLNNEVDDALHYLERFSQLIRTTLEYSDKETISLDEEITYLKHYIEIENLRVEHPITFTEHIASDLDITQVWLVPLLLQPFVENAIVHAFPASVQQPKIDLKVEKIDQTVFVTIVDNGVGYQPQHSKTHKSKGVSISRNRLELTQKKLKNAVKINSTPQGTTVVIGLGEFE